MEIMVKTFDADTEAFIAELQDIARKHCSVMTQLEIELEIKRARREPGDRIKKEKMRKGWVTDYQVKLLTGEL